jgi:alpha-glucosidase (family GH31 glycosyl hydrolase)
MPQHEYIPSGFVVDSINGESRNKSLIRLRSTGQGHEPSFRFTFEAIRPDLFRTTFFSESHPLPPHPSAPSPAVDLKGIIPVVSKSTSEPEVRINLDDINATVNWKHTPVVRLQWGSESPIHADLPFRSYAVDGPGIAHYTAYRKDTLHVGLGEKPAPMDLSGRQFVLSASDCFGYDVYKTDPMYKHIPLLINATQNGCVAMFSTSHSRGHYSIGAEMDGLWGRYKVYRQDYGGLEQYLILGRTLKDVVRTYADLVGYPRLVPRWAFGYIAGGMKYSMLDQPKASEALIEFAEKLKEHDIPCSGFQLSSGYTVAEAEPKTRNVFTWNKHRFPDPEGFAREYHRRGIRLVANVKPYVLENHPEYQRLKEAGALFRDPRTNRSAVTRLWSAGGGESGEGGHIDFTSAAGFQWWYDGVKALRKVGIDCIWNDNNEYTIPDDNWLCALNCNSVAGAHDSKCSKNSCVGLWGRALQTELMAKSSHDALVDLEPGRRPFVLTRSATAGTMRYAASSWSGDNVTSWEGMKGANALSLNAGMSLLQVYGHDIGGFEGPQPSPELLVRWVQLGIHSPRFAINCYKTSPEDNSVGDVIEPWMYPEVTPIIRAAIKRRYELMPYVYSLALESHLTASPAQRWIGWGYEDDLNVWTAELLGGEEQYWLGDSLLIGGVYEPGVSEAKLYLPRTPCRSDHGMTGSEGFINLNKPYQYLEAGQWVGLKSNWQDSIPILAKVGGAVPVGRDFQTASVGENRNDSPDLPEDDYRGVEIFPPPGSSNGRTYRSTWYEDDGITANPSVARFLLSYSCTQESVFVDVDMQLDGYKPKWEQLSIILPAGDERVVMSRNKPNLERRVDSSGRVVSVLELWQ